MSSKGIGVGECAEHGEFFLDAHDSPCPSCEDKEKMSKTISFGEFDAQANGYLSALVHELLIEKDIEPASFSFSVEVTYDEVKDETDIS